MFYLLSLFRHSFVYKSFILFYICPVFNFLFGNKTVCRLQQIYFHLYLKLYFKVKTKQNQTNNPPPKKKINKETKTEKNNNSNHNVK